MFIEAVTKQFTKQIYRPTGKFWRGADQGFNGIEGIEEKMRVELRGKLAKLGLFCSEFQKGIFAGNANFTLSIIIQVKGEHPDGHQANTRHKNPDSCGAYQSIYIRKGTYRKHNPDAVHFNRCYQRIYNRHDQNCRNHPLK